MKKYCLTPTAKRQLIDLYASIIIGTIGVILFLGMAAFIPAMLGGYDEFIAWFGYVGIVSWGLILGIFVILLKRWVQRSIVEC